MHGRHVKIEGEGHAEFLGSVHLIREFLGTLVHKLGMRALAPPVVHDVEIDITKLGKQPFEDEGGVTGVVVLSTSHCAIHTWPARPTPVFVLDVFSCRDFDPGVVIEHCRLMLGAMRIALFEIQMGSTVPDEPETLKTLPCVTR